MPVIFVLFFIAFLTAFFRKSAISTVLFFLILAASIGIFWWHCLALHSGIQL